MQSTPRAVLASTPFRLVGLVVVAFLLPAATRGEADDPVAALREAEEAFAAAATARDRETFAGWIAEDAVFAGGGDSQVGRPAIVDAWAPFFDEKGPRITWSPESVVVAPSGELGMTRGPWRIDGRGADGRPTALEGTFFSVWRRTAEGWRVILDNGTPGRPVPAPFADPFAGLEWLVGTWRGPGLGGSCEETWNPPEGGQMLGMFRLIREGRPEIYEIITLAPDSDGRMEMRLKHFGADLTSWEEKDETVVFPFVSRGPGSLVLDGLAYSLEGEGLRVEVTLEEEGAPAVLLLERAR